MKKLIKSKGFMVTALSVCCVGVLAACFFFGRDKAEAFSPDIQPSEEVSEEWEEPAATTETDKEKANAYQPAREPAAEESYPKVVEESEDEVVVDFAPSGEEIKPEVPEKPETQADTTNPAVTPTYTPEETKPQETGSKEETGNTGTPEPGSKNAAGEVYVPGFGWVMPSTTEQIQMHNDGDPNKMVGDM